jgi:hypothetical protein
MKWAAEHLNAARDDDVRQEEGSGAAQATAGAPALRMPDATSSVAAARAAVAMAQPSVASAVPIHPLVAPIATTGIVWPQ